MGLPSLLDEVKFPATTFRRCQLCGFENIRDICEFRLWQECDEADKPTDKFLVICRVGSCFERLDKHPRMYREVPWGAGNPGHFMLVCGDCPYRKEFACTHPDLKANGGQGLQVYIADIPNIMVCGGGGGCRQIPKPVSRCDGNRKNS